MSTLDRDTTRRPAVVAGLRALADALEKDASLPLSSVPDFYAALYREYDEDGGGRELSVPEKFAALREIATRYGVDITEDEDGSRNALIEFGPVAYRLHAKAGARQKAGTRIVPADEDQVLIGGVR